MPKRALLFIVVGSWLLGGCVLGGGPVVGYGKKRGFYGGVAGYGGVSMAQLSVEMGGNRDGGMLQGRFDVEANRLRLLHGPDENEPSPGMHAGIGYAAGSGGRGLAAVVGPDVGVVRERSNCEGSPIYSIGIEWRNVGGESLFVLAPRYEQLADICLR